jgi:hypothetical protein
VTLESEHHSFFVSHAAQIKEIAVGRAGSPLNAEGLAPTGEWSHYLKICG